MLQADPAKVSKRAKKRGLPQMGTLDAVSRASRDFRAFLVLVAFSDV